MPPRTSIAAFATAVILSTGHVLAQGDSEPRPTVSCGGWHIGARRVRSQSDIVRFYLPRFATVRKIVDVDYWEYYVRYGPEEDNGWLHLMFGTHVGGHAPREAANSSIKWAITRWGCQGPDGGTDWKGLGPEDRRWRHIYLPFGFATYEDVPASAAAYFDKILDTMCCGKGQ
jgi:hypothetical protein